MCWFQRSPHAGVGLVIAIGKSHQIRKAFAPCGCGIGVSVIAPQVYGIGVNQLIAESSPRAGLGLVIKLLKVGLVWCATKF